MTANISSLSPPILCRIANELPSHSPLSLISSAIRTILQQSQQAIYIHEIDAQNLTPMMGNTEGLAKILRKAMRVIEAAKLTEDDRADEIIRAVDAHDRELVEILAQSGSLLVSDRGLSLCNAAAFGNPDIVHALLDSGEVSPDDRGLALCNAAADGFPDIVTILLKSGPIPDEFMNLANSEGDSYPAVIKALSPRSSSL